MAIMQQKARPAMTDGQFVELTVLFRSPGRDPGLPPDCLAPRLFATACIKQVFRDESSGRAVLNTSDGHLIVVVESYEYLVQVLTAWQPRLASTSRADR